MIDLHCHSCFSDGTDEPEALAIKSDALELTALALTDHDTLEGLPRFLAMQPEVKTRLVPGIELSCRFLGKELHILGLLVDHQNREFRARIDEVRARRNQRNIKLVERLQSLGIDINLEIVRTWAPSGLVSRTHFARQLAAMGIVGNSPEAFRKLIGENGSAFVPFQELSPTEAALWIHEAGGVALVAHPGRFAAGRFIWNDAMSELQRFGIDGFEAYYGEYGPAEQRYFLELAARLGMLPSGGSDYHGGNKPGLELGRGRGNLKIPDSVLENLEAARPRSINGVFHPWVS
ncbi:MAG: PHP domain-containing protein [Holophaga sp.]|nr:PHP domain-containing protein [Holophaga sp.]